MNALLWQLKVGGYTGAQVRVAVRVVVCPLNTSLTAQATTDMPVGLPRPPTPAEAFA